MLNHSFRIFQVTWARQYELKLVTSSSSTLKMPPQCHKTLAFIHTVFSIQNSMKVRIIYLFVCLFVGGGRVVRRCWVNFQCRGVLLIWIIVGQGPIALAIGAGGGLFGHFFSPLSLLFSFSLSLGDGPI